MIKKGIKIRGFSKTNIEKTYLRVEVNIKSRGILNNSCPEPRAAGGPVRSLSNDRLPSSDSVAKITAMSSSLTYKEVIKKLIIQFKNSKHVFLKSRTISINTYMNSSGHVNSAAKGQSYGYCTHSSFKIRFSF